MSSIASFFSSLLPTIQADTAADEKLADENNSGADSESSEEAPAEEEEEEEEEPEDLHPAIREECRSSTKCAPLAQHFERCNEKVQAGEGFKGEDCVEEIMMHCVEDCAAPKLFVKLK
ncbi:Non-heme 11 kDa protein of cytochrome bc1 complex [Lentinula guzmanii]|uniref:Non-heme 11 kDa protein of cytochrome bc1 complex n=1 Tax=Lentinula guzmanii TaxID=2804957 RepID=A0AA38JAY5_9AGAR|nr:Non-heme 11 kDa protein of cytochrome bc1 complex [Lentinula guzmanii]